MSVPARTATTKTSAARTKRRADLRIAEEKKALYQWAASLEGCSFTDFATRALDRAVEETIRRHQTITLSTRDMEAFVDALLNPGQPNERLSRYARLHEETLGGR